MTLQERIDTLPPYPDRQQFIHSTPYGEGMSIAGIADYNQSLATAALARLALLRDIYSYAEDQGMETLMDMIDASCPRTTDSASPREPVSHE